METKVAILIILAVLCVLSSLIKPKIIQELDRKYDILRKELKHTNEFPILQKKLIVTGMFNKGEVGYNVNKGYEIFICIDGNDINNIFHVLLHELAHVTVIEYKHSGHFWDNLHKLKAIAGRLGIYRGISRQPYCGHHISD